MGSKILQNLKLFFTRRRRLSSHLKGLIQAGILAGSVGMIYMSMLYGTQKDDLLQAFVTCFSIGFFCLCFETFVFEAMLRRVSSYKVFILRFIWYQSVLIFSFTLGLTIFNQVGIPEAYDTISPRDKTIAGWAVIGFNFVILVNRWMGRNALWMFFMGTYNKPKFERRLLLFIKIPWKPEMQSRDELTAHHHKLQNFIEIATENLLETKGTIYRYEPDGILITYSKNSIKEALRFLILLKRDYPESFQASLAIDQVSIAETGDFKKEILMLSPLFAPCIQSLRLSKAQFLIHQDLINTSFKNVMEEVSNQFTLQQANFIVSDFSEIERLSTFEI